ncbi:hypothetical protein [Rhizobium leguminosarum]|uniref:hypothetical protein n=1 Tax=Rhizobium leguminosarum TaxID=384 RepID=UPI001C914E6E|nr:hypothetical protein [Rhizobium leguminosarum]MBY2914131.1 hypothetical protein [Rhizobium leguminosarum]MBY2969670.1 hypothetical protein [Rhizobium leguminosarum]MBY2977043.1 hypothetical protein [Rhizobium leguminosarum]MBY3005593.1 hypothetical protein [Rhizobium leguminosarum]
MKRGMDQVGLVRNSLRPLFGAKKTSSLYKNLNTVRSVINAANANQILSLVESKQHFPFPGLGNTFPKDPASIPILFFRNIKQLSEPKEITIQISRANHYGSALADSLRSLSNINTMLARGVFDQEISILISGHINQYGWSFVILRKLLMSKLLEAGLPGLSRAVQDISAQFDRRVWSVYCHLLYDIMDPSYDPHSALLAWRQMLHSRGDRDKWYTLILSEVIDGDRATSEDRAQTIMRLGHSSLLDMVLYTWKHFNRLDKVKPDVALDPQVLAILQNDFKTIEISPAAIYGGADNQISDLELYRHAVLFDDIQQLSMWRADLNALVLPGGGEPQSGSYVAKVFTEINSQSLRPNDLENIVQRQVEWQYAWLEPEKWQIDQHLMRATLLAAALRRNANSLLAHRDELAEVIAKTDEFQDFVEEETLIALASDFSAGDILTFIVRDLLFRKTRSRDNDLERRLIFMRLIQSSETPTIAAFIQKLSLERPAVAKQMATVCTRTFLERLFLLMSSIKDVISTRIEICEWMNRSGDETETLIEEIASLKREFANLDTRSDLDSTRIHVDEESLREWFWETQKTSVSRFTQTVLAEGKGSGSFSLLRFLNNKDKLHGQDDVKIESQVGSEHLLLAIFSATLSAFASDKSFGLDAYLSRRIRHGTLSGFIITPLSRIIKKLEELQTSELSEEFDPSHDYATLAVQWRKAFAAQLDDARKNVIQLQVNSDRGLIRADWRTAANIAHVDAAISRIRTRVIESKGIYDIFPDLYALCWDCIEPDLAQLRRYLLRDLLPKASASIATIWADLSPRNHAARRSIIELNATLQNKIHEVCGWFIRPVFRRDSYSLRMLVTSTLSIVRELDDNYEFEEEVSVSDQLNLNRASFDVFGDLLFVVLGNAAKYGVRGGTICVTSEFSDDFDGDTIIGVQVQSFVGSLKEHEVAVARIESAMNIQATEIAKAAVGEGFSGLGKAVGIIRHVRSAKAALMFFADPEKLDISFAIYLPAQIAVNRTQ